MKAVVSNTYNVNCEKTKKFIAEIIVYHSFNKVTVAFKNKIIVNELETVMNEISKIKYILNYEIKILSLA